MNTSASNSRTVDDGATAGDRTQGPGSSIGPYRLLEIIGEGGFGEVWLAEQKEPVKRRVAVKIIKLGMDTRQVVARFEAERQALALMDHPNIAKVFDGGATENGRPYFVMELVKGVPITEYCNKNRVKTGERLRLFVQACGAIQHAHQKGIIHRDIKPSNVLISMQDGAATCKVIDFGIAKATQQELTEKTIYTQLSQFIGTPAYMSPEQAEMTGIDIDTRSDIYSLGVLLYELLTGSTPFDTQSLAVAGLDGMRQIIREQEPVRPSTRLSKITSEGEAPWVSPELIGALRGDLDWIILRCLEKDRTRRYDTANGLAMDVERHLNGEPVAARPPSRLYRVRKLVRRNRVVAGFSASFALVLAGAAIFSSMAYRQELQARRESESARNLALNERLRAEGSERRARELLYAADMNLAQQSLQQDNLGRARRLLDRHRPKPGETDLRGWEWAYLWQFCRSEAIRTLGPFGAGVSQVAFFGNSDRFAALLSDGTSIVDSSSSPAGASAARAGILQGKCFVLLPSGAGVVALADGAAVRFDLAGGRETLFEIPTDYYPRLAVSKSGRYIAAQSAVTLGITVFDLASRKRILEIPRREDWEQGYVHQRALIFSHDERHLIAAPGGAAVLVYDLADGAASRRIAVFEKAHVTCLDLSPDGRWLAVGSGYVVEGVAICDLASGQISKRLSAHKGWMSDVRFSPDGATLATASADQSIRLWDTASWNMRKVLRGHGNEVWAIAFSENGGSLLSGSKDGYVLVWDISSTADSGEHRTFGKGTQFILNGENGAMVRLTSENRAVLLDAGTLRELDQVQAAGSLAAGSTADFFGFLEDTGRLQGWRMTGNKLAPAGSVQVGGLGDRKSAFRVALSAAGQTAAWGPDGNGRVLFAPASNLENAVELPGNGQAPVEFMRSDGALLTMGKTGKTIWELPSGRASRTFGSITEELAVHAIDDFTLLSLAPGRAVFQDAPSGAMEDMRLEWPGNACFAFAPDRHTLAIGGSDAIIRIYDLQTRSLARRLHGHRFNVTALGFSLEGNRVASFNGHGEGLKLWDWRNGQELMNLGAQGELLNVGFFVKNSQSIVAGDAFGTWQVWRAPSLGEIEAMERAGSPWPRTE